MELPENSGRNRDMTDAMACFEDSLNGRQLKYSSECSLKETLDCSFRGNTVVYSVDGSQSKGNMRGYKLKTNLNGLVSSLGSDGLECSSGGDEFESNSGSEWLEGSLRGNGLKESPWDAALKESPGDAALKESPGDTALKESAGYDALKESAGYDAVKESRGDDGLKESPGDNGLKESTGGDGLQYDLEDDGLKDGHIGGGLKDGPVDDGLKDGPVGDGLKDGLVGDGLKDCPGGDGLKDVLAGDGLKGLPSGDGLKGSPECGGFRGGPERDGGHGLEGGPGINGPEGWPGGCGPEVWPGGSRPEGTPRVGGTEGRPRDCGLRGGLESEHKCDGSLVGNIPVGNSKGISLGNWFESSSLASGPEGGLGDRQECNSESNSLGDTPRIDQPESSLETNLPNVARDTMEQSQGDAMVQMAYRVAASLDNASQGVRRSEDGATSECEGVTCSSQTTMSCAFHDHTASDSLDTTAEGSDDGLGSFGNGLFVVEMTDRQIVSLLFGHRPIYSPSNSSSGQASNSPNDMQEARGRYVTAAGARQQNVRENGIQSLHHGENIQTEGLPANANVEQAAATEPWENGSNEGAANDRSNETIASGAYADMASGSSEGAAYADLASGSNEGMSNAEGGAHWIPDPRIERPDYDEIPGLRRLMRPSRRSRMRQRIEEMFSLYVDAVLSEKEKLKMEDLPSCEITEEYIGTKCSVCLVEYELKEDVCKLRCDHLYHKKCIMLWLRQNSSCPLCRRPFKDPATPHGNVHDRLGNFGDPENLENLSSEIRSIFQGAEVVLVAREGDDSFSTSSSDTESSSDSDYSINMDAL